MGWKQNTAIAATIVGLGVGAAAWIDRPTSTAAFEQQQREQQVSDLTDAHDRELQRQEDEAEALRRAEEARRAQPGEHRPPLPKLPWPGK